MNILTVSSMVDSCVGRTSQLHTLGQVSPPRELQQTYLAANDSVNGDPIDRPIDETQVGSGVARLWRTSDKQVPVTTSRDHQVHILVMDCGVGGILDLDSEIAGDVVGEGCAWDRASGSGRDEGRKAEEESHVADG